MQVSTLGPPTHLNALYRKEFSEKTKDPTKETINYLREKLKKDPSTLVEVLIAGACDPEWISQTGNLLKRLFKDTGRLILENKIPHQTAIRIRAVFCDVTGPIKVNSIHRDIVIIQGENQFNASRTILMGYSDFFHSFFCSGLKESRGTEKKIEKDSIVREVSFNAFKALYRYMETKNSSELENLEELCDLWDLVRFCDLLVCPELKDVIEKILIRKTGSIEAFESLNGCDLYQLKALHDHCLQTAKNAQFHFQSSDNRLTATIKVGFRPKDIEKIAKNSSLTSITLEDKRFSQELVTDLVEKLPNLESITIAISSEGISTAARQVIGSSIKVRTLKIEPTFGEKQVPEVKDAAVEVNGLDNIQSLDLRNLPANYRRFAIGLILQLGSQLLDIRLGTLNWVDDKFLAAMCGNKDELPLKLLDLGCCLKITDKTASIIAKNFSNLVVLNISGTLISSEGLRMILESCKKITDLNIGSLNIHNLIALQTILFINLRSLKLTGKNATKEDFEALFRHCTQLQELNVDRCENFKILLLNGYFPQQLHTLTVNEEAFSLNQDLPVGFFMNLRSLKKLVVQGKPDSVKKSLILAQAKVKNDLEVVFIEDKL